VCSPLLLDMIFRFMLSGSSSSRRSPSWPLRKWSNSRRREQIIRKISQEGGAGGYIFCDILIEHDFSGHPLDVIEKYPLQACFPAHMLPLSFRGIASLRRQIEAAAVSISDTWLRWPHPTVQGSAEAVNPKDKPQGKGEGEGPFSHKGQEELGMIDLNGWKVTADEALRDVQAAEGALRGFDTAMQLVGTLEGKFEALGREENPASRQLET